MRFPPELGIEVDCRMKGYGRGEGRSRKRRRKTATAGVVDQGGEMGYNRGWP